MFQDNKTAAMLVMLVFHTNPVGVGLFSDVNAYFVPINLHAGHVSEKALILIDRMVSCLH